MCNLEYERVWSGLVGYRVDGERSDRRERDKGKDGQIIISMKRKGMRLNQEEC